MSSPRPDQGLDVRRGERGFTLIEVMIALTVLLIGFAGVLSLQLTSMHATSFSRHATEASVLAEDKVEELRTVPMVSLVGGDDEVDARGKTVVQAPESNLFYTREWVVAVGATTTTINVEVKWKESGGDEYTIKMASLRTNTP